LSVLLFVSGCTVLSDFVADIKSRPETRATAKLDTFADQPRQVPIDANIFTLGTAEQSVVGEPQIVFASHSDTFSDLARAYGLGYDDIVAANPDVDPWLPGAGTPVLLPTQFVLPNGPRRGVVLNIASKRLFYFPVAADGELQQVFTYPIGIGRVGWETPLGETSVVAKARNPSWWVPASVRREHREMGNPLPAVVPPGPDNPLGTRVLKLGMPGYLIHGTNQPYGVGMRVSHGCVRLYPENIEFLYTLIDIGEPVTIVNEPYLLGQRDGVLFFEAHEPLEDDEVSAPARLQALFDAQTTAAGQPLTKHFREHIEALAALANGVPASAVDYDSEEVFLRVRVVENIVEPDPNELTSEEIRAMIRDESE
jgi:L,D-transpeptidase ErfK/SrfK